MGRFSSLLHFSKMCNLAKCCVNRGCANSAMGQQGRGQLSISCRTPSPDLACSYQVTVGSASGHICTLPTVLEKCIGVWDDPVHEKKRKTVQLASLNWTARTELAGLWHKRLQVILPLMFHIRPLSEHIIQWSYWQWSASVSQCIDILTNAVSLSLDANKSTFIMSPWHNKAAAQNTVHSLELRTFLEDTKFSEEAASLFVCEQARHASACVWTHE